MITCVIIIIISKEEDPRWVFFFLVLHPSFLPCRYLSNQKAFWIMIAFYRLLPSQHPLCDFICILISTFSFSSRLAWLHKEANRGFHGVSRWCMWVCAANRGPLLNFGDQWKVSTTVLHGTEGKTVSKSFIILHCYTNSGGPLTHAL